ncbi:MAG: DUF4279 domain-containing protein [Oscillospiraceae bacterium]|nr:DUF4279 domain-containing protein [Oscillospiraceae bacterium]
MGLNVTKSTVGASLALCGDDFDVDYVSNKLGINPTHIRNKDEVLNNGRRFGQTEWAVEFERECSYSIENQYQKIMSMVKDKTDLLSELCAECNATWHIAFYIYIENGDVPSPYLTKEFIAFAAAIGATVDFDIYVLSSRAEGYRA